MKKKILFAVLFLFLFLLVYASAEFNGSGNETIANVTLLFNETNGSLTNETVISNETVFVNTTVENETVNASVGNTTNTSENVSIPAPLVVPPPIYGIQAVACDSGDVSTVCIISSTKSYGANEVFSGTGTLNITSTGRIQNTTNRTALILNFTTINVQSGGQITGGNLTIIAQNLTVVSGGLISANSLGYTAGLGPGAGVTSNNRGSGGAHGGFGGQQHDGAAGGTPYDSSLRPVLFGSGGSGTTCSGATGGGVIRLIVSSTLDNSGTISSNGAAGSTDATCVNGQGGGAGGSVYVTTQTITGSGIFTANGGNGNQYGGGGSGGRIAVYYNVSSWTGLLSSTVALGNRGGSGNDQAGTIGTLIVVDENDNFAIIKDAFRFQPQTGKANETGVVTSFFDYTNPTFWNFTALTIIGGATLTNHNGTTVNGVVGYLNVTNTSGFIWTYYISGTTNVTFSDGNYVNNLTNMDFYTTGPLTLNFSRPLRLLDNSDLRSYSTGGIVNVTSGFNSTFELRNSYYGSATNQTQQLFGFGEGVQNLIVNTSSTVAGGNLTIAVANITVVSGSTITASGGGYAGGYGPGAGVTISTRGSGGAHGGFGGQNHDGGVGGTPYDSSLRPVMFGSGGSGNTCAGGVGGGIVRLIVSDTLSNSGTISSNGAAGSNAAPCGNGEGGGGGGSVYVTTPTLTGSGIFTANGGNGNQYGGGGGGGRIAVYYNVSSWTGLLGSTVTLGNRGGSGSDTAGTVGTLIVVDEDDNAAFIKDGFKFQTQTSKANETGVVTSFFDYTNPTFWNFTALTIIGGATLTNHNGTTVNGVVGYLNVTNTSGFTWTYYTSGTTNATFLDGNYVNNLTNMDFYTTGNLTLDFSRPLRLLDNSDLRTYSSGVVINVTSGFNSTLELRNSYYGSATNQTQILFGFGDGIQHLLINTSSTIAGGNVTINVTNLTIVSGSTITSSTYGYPSALGPGAGTGSNTPSAAGHGGYGGMNIYSAEIAGVVYGSSLQPVTFGSGGGTGGCANNGGGGGGIIRLLVSNTLSNSGTISSNGGTGGSCSNGGGGGSGGSIYVTTQSFSGSGIFTANGGNGYSYGAGGGGGRIAIYYNASTWTGLLTSTVSPGVTANGQGLTGKPGSLFIFHEDGLSATIKDGFQFQPQTGRANESGIVTSFFNYANPTFWNFTNLTIIGGATLTSQNVFVNVRADYLNITNTSGFVWTYNASGAINFSALDGNYVNNLTNVDFYSNGPVLLNLSRPLRLLDNSDLRTYSTGSIINITSGFNSTLELRNSYYGSATNQTQILLGFGDGIQHLLINTSSTIAGGNVTINTTNLTIVSGSTITSSAYGYTSVVGPGAGGGTNTPSGAGYGGAGGNNSYSGDIGGSIYGSSLKPVAFGSGGGAGSCANNGGGGGGIIRLFVSDTLNSSGTISSNGATGGSCGNGGGGGSGGSIYVTTQYLSGSGVLSAAGGAGGGSYGAPGGGGRIAMYYNASTWAGFVTSSVSPGTVVNGYGRRAVVGTFTYEDGLFPIISFEDPTPANRSGVTSSIYINTTINETRLENATFVWNGLQYNITDASTLLLYNFDNTSNDRAGYISDGSKYFNDGYLGRRYTIVDEFTINESWTETTMTGNVNTPGIYRGSITGNTTPYFDKDIANFNASYGNLELRYFSYPTGPSSLKMQFIDGVDCTGTSYSDTCSEVIPIVGNSTWNTISVPITSATWNDNDGLIDKVRFIVNGAAGTDSLYIDYIKFFNISSATPTYTVGKFGSALSFDGVDDFVEVPDFSSPDFAPILETTVESTTSDMSIALWVKRNAGSPGELINRFDSANMRVWKFALTNTQLSAYVTDTASSYNSIYEFSTTNISSSDGAWHHVVFVKDNADCRFFYDGIQVARKLDCPNGIDSSRTQTMFIGRLLNNSINTYFNGSMDELRLYNRALSPTEVSMLYKTNLARIDATTWNLLINQSDISNGGNYTYYVATSDVGLYSHQSEIRTLLGDTIPPYVLSLNDASGFNTSARNISFNYTCADAIATTVNGYLYIDGILVGSNNSANGSISSITATNISGGPHVWNVSCSDPSGNFNYSDTRSFYIDIYPPAVSSNMPIGYTTGLTTDSFNFTVIDDRSPTFNCSLYFDTFFIKGTNATVLNNTPSSIVATNYTAGTHTWNVICTDIYGNTNTTSTLTFTADFSAPIITLVAPINNTASRQQNLLFNFSFVDDFSSNATCSLYIDTILASSSTTPNGTVSGLAAVLTGGSHNWSVTCVDPYGNSRSSETRVLYTDIYPPTLTTLQPSNAYITGASSLQVNVTPADGLSVLSAINCSLKLWTPAATEQAYTNTTLINTYRQFALTNLSEGDYAWNVSCSDVLGNTNTSATNTFYVDHSAPNITRIDPVDNFVSGTANLTFNFSFIDNIAATANCSLYIGGSRQSSNASAVNNTITTLMGTLNQTNNSWFVACVDPYGNEELTDSQTVLYDSVGPVVSSSTYVPSNLDAVDPGQNLTFTATVSDALSAVDTVILKYQAADYGQFNYPGYSEIVMTPTSNTTFHANITLAGTEKTYQYRILANDTFGNSYQTSIQTFNSIWDCTWHVDTGQPIPDSLGSIAGFATNKSIGNITLVNTGDVQFDGNNCTLILRFSHNLASGRIYFDNLVSSPYYNVPAGTNTTVAINASFPYASTGGEIAIITARDQLELSSTAEQNVTATLVTKESGPYLAEAIASTPGTLNLTPSNFSISAYVQNIMGSDILNVSNTAFNVTTYWNFSDQFAILEGNQTSFYENISNDTQFLENVTFGFTNLANISPGSYAFMYSVYGYDDSGALITDVDNNTVLNTSTSVIFFCFNATDGVQVTECGSLDPDNPETVVTITTPGGGGGGGSGGGGGGGPSFSLEQIQKLFQTATTYELVRGENNSFPLIVENTFGYPMDNVSVTLTGLLSRYLNISPRGTFRIPINNSKNFSIEITAPDYFSDGVFDINFTISAIINKSRTFENVTYERIEHLQEQRTISLLITSISRENSSRLINRSYVLITEMNSSRFNTRKLESLLAEAEGLFLEKKYASAKEITDQIAKAYQDAYTTQNRTAELTKAIASAEYEGLEAKKAKRLLLLSEAAFLRGDYTTALARIQDAEVTLSLETVGKLNLGIFILHNWAKILLYTVITAVILYILSLLGTYFIVTEKLKSLEKEKEILMQLIKEIQRETFALNKMSMEQYHQGLMQYDEKVSSIIKNIIALETKKRYIFKPFTPQSVRLTLERDRLIQHIKDTQNMYIHTHKIEARLYEGRMKTYTSDLAEIEEKIVNDEVAKTMRKRWF